VELPVISIFTNLPGMTQFQDITDIKQRLGRLSERTKALGSYL
jgi:hypothetical protein